MEDGKVDWSETQKIDRIRRAHAQRGLLKIMGFKIQSQPNQIQNQSWHVVFVKGDYVINKGTMKQGELFINMSVQPALVWGGKIGICDSGNSCEVPKHVYCTSRVVVNSNLYNGTSSNWKADWARFIGKSYSQVVGSNLATAKVKAQQVSTNNTNSLAVKLKTCRAKNVKQRTFLAQKKMLFLFFKMLFQHYQHS